MPLNTSADRSDIPSLHLNSPLHANWKKTLQQFLDTNYYNPPILLNEPSSKVGVRGPTAVNPVPGKAPTSRLPDSQPQAVLVWLRRKGREERKLARVITEHGWICSTAQGADVEIYEIGRITSDNPFGQRPRLTLLSPLSFFNTDWEQTLTRFLDDNDPRRQPPKPAQSSPSIDATLRNTAGPVPGKTTHQAVTDTTPRRPAGRPLANKMVRPPDRQETARPAGRKHVFISYSRADQSYVEMLVAHLGKHRITVWIDETGIDYGSEWPRVIEEQLGSSAAVVVIMTPAGRESEWVGTEVQQAKDTHKTILPLLLSGERFMTLNTRQYEDVTGNKMPSTRWVEQLSRLLDAT